MSKNTRTRILLVAVAALLLVTLTVGGTLAWLADSTSEIVNTFTHSTIDVELDETTGTNYEMVPSVDIAKDPKVTVKAGSEASYVFVVVTETGSVTIGEGDDSVTYTFDDFLEYAIATGWEFVADTSKTEENDVYVLGRAVAETTADTPYAILENNKVSTKDDVTKEMMDALTAANYPKLTFQAYAIQQANGNDTTDGLFTMAEAWTQLGVKLDD